MSHLTIRENNIGTSPFLQAAETLEDGHDIATLELITSDPGDTYLGALERAIDRDDRLKAVIIKRLATTSSTSYHIFCATLAHHNTITAISLYQFPLNRASILTLTHNLSPNSSLKRLSLKNCSLNDFHARQIAKLIRRITKLQFIDLGHNQIGDPGAEALAGALPFNLNLRSFGIAHNSLTPIGITLIADVLQRSSHLSDVMLGGHSNSESSALALLEAIKASRTLRVLNLEGAPMPLTLSTFVDSLPQSRYLEQVTITVPENINITPLQEIATARFTLTHDQDNNLLTMKAESRTMALELPRSNLPLPLDASKMERLDLTNYRCQDLFSLNRLVNYKTKDLTLIRSTNNSDALTTLRMLERLTISGE